MGSGDEAEKPKSKSQSSAVKPEPVQQRLASIQTLLNILNKDIQNINDQAQKAKLDAEEIGLFRGMYRSLDRYYTKFEILWEEYVGATVGLGLQISTKQNDFFDKLKKNVHEINTVYEFLESSTFSQSGDDAQSKPSSGNNTTTVIEGRRFHLPKLVLPHFNGNIVEWPYFRDTFLSLVHKDESLSKIVKFHFLHTSLTGVAHDVIKHLPKQESSYDLAWRALMEAFDKKRLLAISYLDKILDFKKHQGKATQQSLQFFITEISESVEALRLMRILEPHEFILFYLAIRNLDDKTRESFEIEYVGVDYPTFSILSDFVKQRCQALELMSKTSSTSTDKSKVHCLKPKPVLCTSNANTFNNGNKGRVIKEVPKPMHSPCPACNEHHRLQNCLTFSNATPNQRHEMITKWQGCRNCLSDTHSTKTCRSKWHCRFCKSRHNSLLHLPRSTSNRPNEVTPSLEQPRTSGSPHNRPSNSTAITTLSCIGDEYQVVLGTAEVHILDQRNNPRSIRVVIDSGSHYSFITEDAARNLGFHIKPFKCKLSTLGGIPYKGIKGIIACKLRSRASSSYVLHCKAVVVDQITSDLPYMDLPEEVWRKYKSYELADPNFWQSQPVSFLLGADMAADLWTGSIITIDPHKPKLFSSKFGYVVTGKLECPVIYSNVVSLLSTKEPDEKDDISSLLKRFWELEEPRVSLRTLSLEDEACENHFKDTHYRIQTGRYGVQLPFKQSNPVIRNFERVAFKRFHSLENKLGRNPALKTLYHDFMKEYTELGHMSVATVPAKYLIPHHCVTKLIGESLKLRVVFDGSARSEDGSLNDHLLAGPKLQNDVADLLLNFRIHAVAFITDLVKMFRQILVDPCHQPFLQILWRFSSLEPIQRYQLHTVTYGLVSSPYQAIRVIMQLVEDEGQKFPEIREMILSDTYVDDLVSGAKNVQEAVCIVNQIKDFFANGGFTLGKWASNKSEVLAAVSEQTAADPISLESKEEFGVKVLGLQWLPTQDIFTYKVNIPEAIMTKRAILSSVAKIYDPLGYLSPVVFLAKTIVQDLWKSGLEWDDQIPDDSATTWNRFVNELDSLGSVEIPRYIGLDKNISAQLVGFADASEKGYCASVFLRIQIDDVMKSYLIKAKTRLAPIKIISIPKLELCAALLLAKLIQSIPNRFKRLITHPTYLFTDSSVVLAWIRTPSHKLKTFIANRVTEIIELTSIEAWKHVKSSENPSDCGSRGLLPSQLATFTLWWQGPSWLLTEDFGFTNLKDFSDKLDSTPELKESTVTLVTSCSQSCEENYIIQWMERFSSYLKFLRSLCYVYRFIHKCKRNKSHQGSLRVTETSLVLTKIIKLVQSNHFFKSGPPNSGALPNNLRHLSPFVDEAGVVRVGGRLRLSLLPESKKYPILLPSKCHLSYLIVSHYHKIYLHPGSALLQALLQNRFWFLSARNLIRKVAHQCVRCYRLKPKSFTPLMGDLPKCRFKEGRAFAHVGVDFAGPFSIRDSLRRKAPITKGYLAVFVCMSTKAVHLEAVSRMTTEAFLSTFDRFIARRGLPEHVFSDNGTNFVGAANELKLFTKWACETETQGNLQEYALKKEVKWSFQPPSAPHFGGIWEAAVREAKRLMLKVYGQNTMTFEELCTLFARIEAVLNSRPLCALTNDPNDFAYLSPGHFLIGAPLLSAPEPSLLNLKENRLSRWQAVNQKLQHFWSRWNQEYLSTLQRRAKWTKSERNVCVGELVLLKDPLTNPLEWQIGRVSMIHPGADGIVRVATVRTPTTVLKRPVVKLAPLLPPNSCE